MSGLQVEAILNLVQGIISKHGEKYKFIDDGYKALVESLTSDDKLNAIGIQFLNDSLPQQLQTLDNVISTIEQEPNIRKVPISKPIFIMGFMRTGSTLVHNLFNQDPGFLCPPLWQALVPVPAPEGDISPQDPRYMAVKQLEDMTASLPGFLQRHQALAPTAVEECFFHWRTGINKVLLYAGQNMDHYTTWYENVTEDYMISHYQQYKEELQLLAYKQGFGSRPYVRKDSLHLASIGALLKVFPDARFVHLLRNPVHVIASTCSVQLNACMLYYDPHDVDIPALGRRILRHADHVINKYMDYREAMDVNCLDITEQPLPNCIDIYYDDLVAAPIDTMKKIYDYFNIKLSDAAMTNMDAYLENNPINKHGKHNYDLSTYGISNDDVNKVFKRYIEYFNIKC